ncbi:HpcH/HpaI aldolase/citrate lyase family protein [Microbacterium gorillae]|uniref:HpcH/HpaI aldolase/citrate lyase family protein n=1 Tax=Microbacterium gorillae TaxID=1231063 RepID=UPI000590F016|nr:CoA ester lyase [Microbacterium gorillae]
MSDPLEQGPALLFCPADRPERWGKALERADAVIIDLEDAVLPAARPGARDALTAATLDPARVIVRVNPVDSPDFAADLAAVRATAVTHVMLAKTESARSLDTLDGLQVIALCETARGVLAAEEIAAHRSAAALMWGPEDLVASLGGTDSRYPDGTFRDVARHARSRVLLAARAFDRVAIDTVHLNIADTQGLAEEARDAVASGFAATACIHPSQVEIIRDSYRPSADEVSRARELLAAAATEHGVFRYQGRMVDEPVLRHARAVLARAER